MKCLGFKYEVRKEGYYVDRHEKPSKIEYHKHFVSQHLTYANGSAELKNKWLGPKDSGYQYKTEYRVKMVEYHVDACKAFQERMNEETKLGGKLSMRMSKEGKPLIMFGHDEAIFKQNLLTKKSWYSPDGISVWYQKMWPRSNDKWFPVKRARFWSRDNR